jgi:4-carboxymuconolactone decarboxylase
MFRKLVGIWALSLAMAPVFAQSHPEVRMRGDRFRPLTYEEMTDAQRAMTDRILAGDRGSMNGPYNVLLRSPEMGDAAQQFGAQVRFHSSLSRKLNEFAILLTARYWTAQYVWYAHRRYALDAGLNPAVIDAVAEGKRPAAMQPDEAALYQFCTELLHTKQLSDATFRAAVDRFGERGVVDLMGVLGYYHLVSMVLNVDRYPMPDGVGSPLKPLATE